MVGLWIIGGVVAALFYVYCVVDCAFTERMRVRGLPKAVWILVILIFPMIGGILWLVIGRARRANPKAVKRGRAPDDDPEFLRRLGRDRESDARIRKLEQELSELDDKRNKGKDNDKPGRRDG
jgi:hypothetical protein